MKCTSIAILSIHLWLTLSICGMQINMNEIEKHFQKIPDKFIEGGILHKINKKGFVEKVKKNYSNLIKNMKKDLEAQGYQRGPALANMISQKIMKDLDTSDRVTNASIEFNGQDKADKLIAFGELAKVGYL